MKTVDALLGGRIVDLAGADVAVQHRVGKAQIVLIRLAAEAVDGHLFH